MHRDDGAGEAAGARDLGQRRAGVGVDVLAHLLLLVFGDGPLPARAEVEVFDGADSLPLSEELLDEGQRDAESVGDVLPCAVVLVAGGDDAGAQVEGEGFHGAGFYHEPEEKSTEIFKISGCADAGRPGVGPTPGRLHIF